MSNHFSKLPKELEIIQIDDIEVELTRKDIKNMHLRVHPPKGRVSISAPRHVDKQHISHFLSAQIAWIREQKKAIEERIEIRPKTYQSGESHFFLGRPYRMECQSASHSHVILDGSALKLFTSTTHSSKAHERILTQWYRQQAKLRIPDLLNKWQSVTGVRCREWRLKKMKTRWGSCNTHAARIWLNLELIKYPIECLEYVIVHELVHFYEHAHNDQFYNYMTQFMPDWPQHKKTLEAYQLKIA